MGTAVQSHTRWHNDALDDCSDEDRVWGWSIRSSEVLHQEQAKINDNVLVKMLKMSLFDKKPGAPAWIEQPTVKHGIRTVSNMIVRVLQRCLKTEAKVANLSVSSFG